MVYSIFIFVLYGFKTTTPTNFRRRVSAWAYIMYHRRQKNYETPNVSQLQLFSHHQLQQQHAYTCNIIIKYYYNKSFGCSVAIEANGVGFKTSATTYERTGHFLRIVQFACSTRVHKYL